MKKFWLVLSHEYLRHVLRRRFLFALLSFPLIAVLFLGVIAIEVMAHIDTTPFGYVESPTLFPDLVIPPSDSSSIFPKAQMITFTTEAEAQAALESGEIQAYFILAQDYLTTGNTTMVANESVGENVQDDFSDILGYNLALNLPPATAQRLQEGFSLIIRSADGSREMDSQNFLVIVMPLLAGLLFMIAINTGGGYLLQAVVEEKENRTMEIIVTSISPGKLMAAKTIGNLSVGLTQLIVWITFVLLIFPIFQDLLPAGLSLDIDPSIMILLVVTLLPAFLLVGALMAAVGSTAIETREAQQIAGLFTLPIFIPYWFLTPLMFNPNSPLSVTLSMFPLTAPVALPLRAAFTTIPLWQSVFTVVILTISAMAAMWLAGRIFRLGMLRYGKKISLKEIFHRTAI